MGLTPGPWRRGIGSDAHTVFDREGRIIADRCGCSDGNLIAAAPDLLSAAQEILVATTNNDSVPESARAAVRMAISKAKYPLTTE